MIVVLDASEPRKESVRIFPQKISRETDQTASFLLLLDEILLEVGNTVQDITGLVVRLGNGRFSSTRAAVIVANSFAFTLGLPIVCISKEESLEIENLEVKLKETSSKYVLASYYAEPNITKPSK
jgi:hypothetical protein